MLLRPKWIAGHVLVVALAAVFVALGCWQYGRHLDARDRDRAAASQRAAPSLDAPDVTTLDDTTGRARVSAGGTYDAAHQVLVRGRVRGGAVGVGVLTPLRLDDGTAVLVDRGFVAGTPDAAPPPPPGSVRVAGTARGPQSVQGDERAEPTGTPAVVDRVVPDAIGHTVPYPLRPVWIALDAQDPVPDVDGGDPVPAELAVADDDSDVNHLSYALQWWAFALIPMIGWPILLWRVTQRGRRTRETTG